MQEVHLNMISRIKNWLYKNRRLIKRLREENIQLKDQMINKRKLIKSMSKNIVDTCNDFNLLGVKCDKVVEKKAKASKLIATLKITMGETKRRREEFLRRLDSKIPDEVIGGRFENYKYWLAEPFIVDEYEQHLKVNPKTTFISPNSCINSSYNILAIIPPTYTFF